MAGPDGDGRESVEKALQNLGRGQAESLTGACAEALAAAGIGVAALQGEAGKDAYGACGRE